MIPDDTLQNHVKVPVDINKRRYQALMLTGILLPLLLYPFLSMLFLPTGLDYVTRIFFSRIIIWSVVGIMFLFAQKGEMQNFFLWPEEQYNTSFYIKAIVGVYLLCFAANFAAHIPYWLGVHESNAVLYKILAAMQKYPVLIYFSAITAGITEEFVFRGYILSRLSVFFKNKHIAVLISAILFAFIHLTYKTWTELIFAFLLGLIFGYHYQRYRNIKVLIVVHTFVDVLAFVLYNTHHK